MIAESLIGLPLEAALAACAREGLAPQVEETIAPRERDKAPLGTPRVIAVRGECLIVAYFNDGDPKEPHAAE